MPRVRVWERRIGEGGGEETPCPDCRGRGDEDCLTCGGEGVVGEEGN